MTRIAPKLLLAAGLGLIGTVLPAADPEPKSAPAGPDKPADWSKYTSSGEVHGEVTKADESGFTLRVTYYAPKGGTNNSRPQLNRGGGNNSRRQGGQRPPQMVEQHHDYVLKYADNGQVRQMKLPPKTDDKGKKVEYTVKELENAKKPAGMPYYAAARGDLQNGSQVEVHLVRLKEIPAAKVTENDLQVKYVVIHSLGSTGSAGANDPKKK